MEDGDFEWHAPKRELNLEKHGIAFEDAVTIWSGPVATRLSSHDREARFIPAGGHDGADRCGRVDHARKTAAADPGQEGEYP